MPSKEAQQGLMPSIIDRLIDPGSGGTAWRRGYGIEQMMQSVQRDLEDLLNTRQTHQGLPEEFKEVQNSLVAYGLPDLNSLNAATPQQRQQIGRVIESIIARFEPRLKDIKATMIDGGTDNKARTIKFRIDARMRVDPAPEVAFDTILELTTGHYSIKPA
jgi:type VI secretion system protein ImpF